MNPEAIGKFISEERKAKGLTQKELGEALDLSDKAVSKWENGRSMPDLAVMDDLCKLLDISINELLSGEKLSEDSYTRKAEENMKDLMNETTHANRASRIGSVLLGSVCLIAVIFFSTLSFGGTMTYGMLLDIPSLIFMLFCIVLSLAFSGNLGNFGRGVCLAFSHRRREAASEGDIHNLVNTLRFTSRVSILWGIIIGLLTFFVMMRSLAKPETIGPDLAVCVLTLFYGLIFAVFCEIIAARLRALN